MYSFYSGIRHLFPSIPFPPVPPPPSHFSPSPSPLPADLSPSCAGIRYLGILSFVSCYNPGCDLCPLSHSTVTNHSRRAHDQSTTDLRPIYDKPTTNLHLMYPFGHSLIVRFKLIQYFGGYSFDLTTKNNPKSNDISNPLLL